MAAVLLALGVDQGDRVLIYMQMIPEAAFAMLACARIGAIHSVVFGGFASVSLAPASKTPSRRSIISADAGAARRQGDGIQAPARRSDPVVAAQAGERCAGGPRPGAYGAVAGRDHDYAALRERHLECAACRATWVDPLTSSYTLYTSGTTGRPKGVQRDVAATRSRSRPA